MIFLLLLSPPQDPWALRNRERSEMEKCKNKTLGDQVCGTLLSWAFDSTGVDIVLRDVANRGREVVSDFNRQLSCGGCFIPDHVLKTFPDELYEKRKNAALEVSGPDPIRNLYVGIELCLKGMWNRRLKLSLNNSLKLASTRSCLQ